MNVLINKIILDSINFKQKITQESGLLDSISNTTNIILSAFKNNKKIFIAGNGGSASDAQHMAGEFVGRFFKNRKGLPAIALTTDTSILTSIANDFGFEHVFSRQLEANAVSGDVFFAISTSGNSKNIIKAVEYANQNNIYTIALTDSSGGVLKNISKTCINVPSSNTARVQEAHILIIHIICELIETELFK